MGPTCQRANIGNLLTFKRVAIPAQAGIQSAPFIRTHDGLDSGLRRKDGNLDGHSQIIASSIA